MAAHMSNSRRWFPVAGTGLAAAGVVMAFALANRGGISPVVPGRAAPGFTAFDLAGERTSLKDFKGKVLLINVWATWCPPCQEEMPSMQRLYEAVAHEDFEILAVSVDAPFGERDAAGQRGGDLQAFAERLGITFPILHDPTGRIQQTYQTTGLPESFVVDRSGIIFKKVAGATAWDAEPNVQLIRRLLAE
jgi:peroxiredoxin